MFECHEMGRDGWSFDSREGQELATLEDGQFCCYCYSLIGFKPDEEQHPKTWHFDLDCAPVPRAGHPAGSVFHGEACSFTPPKHWKISVVVVLSLVAVLVSMLGTGRGH